MQTIFGRKRSNTLRENVIKDQAAESIPRSSSESFYRRRQDSYDSRHPELPRIMSSTEVPTSYRNEQYGHLTHQTKPVPLSPNTREQLFGKPKPKDPDETNNIEIFNIEIHSKYQPKKAERRNNCTIVEELAHIPNEIRKYIIPN